MLIDICVAVLLDNFELSEKEKYKEQFIQLIAKLKETNERVQENVFSKWNPYRYMKPSPEVLNVVCIPEKLRWRVRKVVFDNFMYIEDKDNGKVPPKCEQFLDHIRAFILSLTLRHRPVSLGK